MFVEKIPQSVLEELDIKELIKSREISPEDFYILEELALISKQLIIADFHNFFSLNRERSAEELRKRIDLLTIDDLSQVRRKLFGLLLDFVEKYNWAVAWNLVSVFERRK